MNQRLQVESIYFICICKKVNVKVFIVFTTTVIVAAIIPWNNWTMPIHWVSKLQTEIALSTAEAEYIALSQALREVIPMMEMMKELHRTFPLEITIPNFNCTVHEDNQSCISMANRQKFSPRTKHIALKYHHCVECPDESFVELARTCSELNKEPPCDYCRSMESDENRSHCDRCSRMCCKTWQIEKKKLKDDQLNESKEAD